MGVVPVSGAILPAILPAILSPIGASGIVSASARLFQTGLVADWNARKLLAADASEVATWADAKGAYVATKGAAGPVLDIDGWSDGSPAVTFTRAASQHLRVDAAAALATTPGPGPFTVAALVRMTAVDVASQSVFGMGHSNDYGLQAQTALATAGLWAKPPLQNGREFAGSTVRTDEDTLFAWVVNGASSAIYINGEKVTGDVAWTSPPWAVPTKAAIGCVPGSGTNVANFWGGKLSRLLLWNRALDDAQWAATVDALHAQALQRFRFVVLGDSISVGYGVANLASWCNTITLPKACFGSGTLRGVVTNKAVNGRTIDDVSAALSTDLASAPYSAYMPSVIVPWCGTNNFPAGDSVSAALAKYWALIADIRAARPLDYVVAVTPLPRSTHLAETAALAAGIRAGWAANGASALWDAGAIEALATPSSTYYQSTEAPNYVHPNADGQLVLRDDFVARGFFDAAVNGNLRRMRA